MTDNGIENGKEIAALYNDVKQDKEATMTMMGDQPDGKEPNALSYHYAYSKVTYKFITPPKNK